MEEPSPAPCSTSTSCPARTSSVTPAGVSATRYSRFLTSRGTPTRIAALLVLAGRFPRVTGSPHHVVGAPGRGALGRSLGTLPGGTRSPDGFRTAKRVVDMDCG